jgi:hypothetical protein
VRRPFLPTDYIQAGRHNVPGTTATRKLVLQRKNIPSMRCLNEMLSRKTTYGHGNFLYTPLSKGDSGFPALPGIHTATKDRRCRALSSLSTDKLALQYRGSSGQLSKRNLTHDHIFFQDGTATYTH